MSTRSRHPAPFVPTLCVALLASPCCLAADVGDSECRGRAETGLCGHETAQTIPIPQILTNRRSQIAIVKIPLPRDFRQRNSR